MALCRTGTLNLEITWMRNCLGVGLDVQLPRTMLLHVGHQEVTTTYGGYTKDRVYIPPLPTSIDNLKRCNTVAAATVDMGMLRSLWEELDYRIDICRVTKGSHIGHL
jgi:hypothetical protein